MPLKDMAMSVEEAKEEYGLGSPSPDNLPKYPYGLCIYLNDETLEKLGLSATIAVGTKFTLMAEAEVRGTSSRQNMKGDSESSVDLQIVAMEVGAPAKSNEDRANNIYAKK